MADVDGEDDKPAFLKKTARWRKRDRQGATQFFVKPIAPTIQLRTSAYSLQRSRRLSRRGGGTLGIASRRLGLKTWATRPPLGGEAIWKAVGDITLPIEGDLATYVRALHCKFCFG